MSKPSEFQLQILKQMKEGSSLSVERSSRRNISLRSSSGIVTKIMRNTFEFLFWKRYIDPNGHDIHGKDYYRVSEQGLKALEDAGI